MELYALFFGVVDLFDPGRHLGIASAVNDVAVVGAEPEGGTDTVHGGVAAAENGDVFAVDDGRVVVLKIIGAHQVRPRQVFVGGINADQVLTGNAHEIGQAGAGADEDGIVTQLEQLVDRLDFADDG